MPYYESGKRTQDAIEESLGKKKPKATKTKAPAKATEKKETMQQYMNRLRREAIERAKAAR